MGKIKKGEVNYKYVESKKRFKINYAVTFIVRGFGHLGKPVFRVVFFGNHRPLFSDCYIYPIFFNPLCISFWKVFQKEIPNNQ